MGGNGSSIGNDSVLRLWQRMIDWPAGKQVAEGRCRGAVYYPTENHFCPRESACAMTAFMHRYLVEGDPIWKDRALAAMDYVLDSQEEDGGYAELGRDGARIDEGSMVSTAPVACNLIAAVNMGLPAGKRVIECLRHIAEWILKLEWQPGAFYHDENHIVRDSRIDCQNTTAMAACAMAGIERFLSAGGEAGHAGLIAAARRAADHLIEGQSADGHWPYTIGAEWLDVSHQGMTLCFVTGLAADDRFSGDTRLVKAVGRGADWLLSSGIRDDGSLNWEIETSWNRYLTQSYFLVATALNRAATLNTDRREDYLRAVSCLLNYVVDNLDAGDDYDAVGPLKVKEDGEQYRDGYPHQYLAWNASLLGEILRAER